MGFHKEEIQMKQQFWRAEVQNRTVITRTDGYLLNGVDLSRGLDRKSYRSRDEAERAAKADYAKKLRVGYLPISEAELIPLMRFVYKIGIRAEGNRPETFGRPSKNLVYACRLQKFWRCEYTDGNTAIWHGDVGGKVVAQNYPTSDMRVLRKANYWAGSDGPGWYQSARKELRPIEGYIEKMNERLAKQPAAAPADLPAPETPLATIVPRKVSKPKAAKIKREGPFAEAFTSPVVHFFQLVPAKSDRSNAPPRATSGGRAIMAEGQAWPSCSSCGEPLSLYLQFDIEPQMQLGFIPGSHLLVFNCSRCSGGALTVPSDKLPAEWLSPANPQTYRVILNRPAAREAIFPADPSMVETRLKLTRAKEKVSSLIEGEDGRNLSPGEPPRGREGPKIGGIPARIQPWRPPRCHCGAPLGFVFQVPLVGKTGWRSKQKESLGFFGAEAFIHACTKQCSPYATIVIPDR